MDLIRFTEHLYTEMQESLQQEAMDSPSTLQRADRSLKITEASLSKLRDFTGTYTFRDEAEEITFFKDIKPRFHKELFYWTELKHIELNKPIADHKEAKRYILRILASIDLFLQRNHRLYTYYKLGHSLEDGQLFLRNRKNPSLLPDEATELDRNFSTVASTILARIMAMEEVVEWLNIQRIAAESPDSHTEGQPKLNWTGSKAQLIEIVYALESYGVFNNGKTNVKEVMEYFQYCFNVPKVANYYGYFQGMRIRKKDRTPFLNGLIDHTLRRMDESDEFPRFS